ncbi:MAG: dihydrofolate reductase [Saprospiraceae bacterium]|nr:dihydrofolate reductase [Bacteroidia bacterium]NNE13439.1 dihydrofolate reductase [Saprospiraceae bacterium]NNL93808.1 dihydrofolate reductase [Saprospiraceae bacterium]
MIISTIVAVGNNNVIGVDNDLPWHMPADLQFFKKTTLGFNVLMGRKSFDSVGRPLPGRTNIVVTRQNSFYHSGVITVHSIQEGILEAKKNNQEELFIIGGSNVYTQTKDLWNKLYLTKIDVDIPNGTAFFPEINFSNWNHTWEEKHKADEKNPHDFSFNLFTRK